MKSSSPFFSIIIPALNEEVCLPILLESLSKQNYKNFEVIVVDGNSKDDTLEKAKSFVGHVPFLQTISSKVRNVSYQRNLGVRNSIGEYLIFSDADNEYPCHYLEKLSTQLNRQPRDFFTNRFKSNSNDMLSQLFCVIWNMVVEFKKNTGHPLALGAGIGCKRKVFDSIGGFNESLRYAEDKRLAEDALKKGYKLHIFKSPVFIVSLRRIKRDGVLKSIHNYVSLNLKYYNNQDINQEKDYPMGGDI